MTNYFDFLSQRLSLANGTGKAAYYLLLVVTPFIGGIVLGGLYGGSQLGQLQIPAYSYIGFFIVLLVFQAVNMRPAGLEARRHYKLPAALGLWVVNVLVLAAVVALLITN
ncbi:hypothetical protein INR77_00875 [Erythrobacter sp. SCSIO 43205]|uniref:hypothetical protein n=1 Tax=Erythrobacter sp. SCSIO 43205 TaxID=2779361 RepID=UPI001CA8494D|nr:hypothetical protein [Erythrobacter sp. SCSIO 43205]UAB78339.1 hypothetical protein INR77_00875 [Erythrobacter sp. SCSIO 43205]